MSLKRYTRRSNTHSKSVLQHDRMLDIIIMYYNFCRPHGSLRVTPAMEAGLADSIWSIADLFHVVGYHLPGRRFDVGLWQPLMSHAPQ